MVQPKFNISESVEVVHTTQFNKDKNVKQAAPQHSTQNMMNKSQKHNMAQASMKQNNAVQNNMHN